MPEIIADTPDYATRRYLLMHYTLARLEQDTTGWHDQDQLMTDARIALAMRLVSINQPLAPRCEEYPIVRNKKRHPRTKKFRANMEKFSAWMNERKAAG